MLTITFLFKMEPCRIEEGELRQAGQGNSAVPCAQVDVIATSARRADWGPAHTFRVGRRGPEHEPSGHTRAALRRGKRHDSTRRGCVKLTRQDARVPLEWTKNVYTVFPRARSVGERRGRSIQSM